MGRVDRASGAGASDIAGKARQRLNRPTPMLLLRVNKTNQPNVMIGLDRGGDLQGVVVPL